MDLFIIQVDNTDAEGRLILADALYYTSSTFQPHILIDLATLTSAIGIALGTGKYAGIFTNSDKLWEQLQPLRPFLPQQAADRRRTFSLRGRSRYAEVLAHA